MQGRAVTHTAKQPRPQPPAKDTAKDIRCAPAPRTTTQNR
ncbi:MAG TPA: hypothetical protein DEF41_03150 [Desulfovibrio sp.]|uniref:Uncharacterized protein n=1 Tax=Nitratidesulfovibrio vulgaris (strain ATCC 29579 / DSM 644 / CCUG 34227 / NCIMB 8303 / VKM B-1760 / Hildenborough) TaxID=882 RepID=Q725I9_NITV2|nr:hypothetical protein DVU_3160 [Nitratidesulfovibrio vulgaris str. Hildenborough]HBW15146.1 hypothetical protein [Desulfovibrio sp.]